jgi:magnesium transporter
LPTGPASDDTDHAIAARLFDADRRDRAVKLERNVVRRLGKNQLLWVDVDVSAEPDWQAVIREPLGLEAHDIGLLEHERDRASLRRSEDRLHLNLEALEAVTSEDDDHARLVRREVRILAAPNMIVTLHAGRIDALERFIQQLDGESGIGALTAADLMSSLVDEVIAGYFRLVELIERDIDELDQRALHGRPNDDVLAAIVSLRQRIGLIRRTLAPHRDALAAFGRPDMRVEELVGRPWAGLGDRLERAIDTIETLRESLFGTYDVYMGRVAQRANDIVKVLTLLSAVLLPSVVLAGVMGMNFKLAFFEDPTNFVVVIGAMSGLAIAVLLVARWRAWL